MAEDAEALSGAAFSNACFHAAKRGRDAHVTACVAVLKGPP